MCEIDNTDSEPPESAAEYWVTFNQMLSDIQSSLNSPDVSAPVITGLKAKIADLQKYATSATVCLPKYDVRRSQEEIESVRKLCAQVEEKIQPRKKFSFSARSKAKKVDSKPEETKVPNAPDHSPSCVKEEVRVDIPGSVIVEGREGEHIDDKMLFALQDTLSESNKSTEERPQMQLLIRNCTNCVVSLKGSLGSARFENVRGCRVFLGPCHTSVYTESCSSCLFFIWCHQLRIHKTEQSDFYVFVNSHPIIEDCSTLRFAPYTATYAGLEGHSMEANLHLSKNWSNVVDFKWHRSTPSPNWEVLPASDRISSIDIEGWDVEDESEI